MSAEFPLAIFAKAPLPGQVKTRLIPALGIEGATRLHERLLRHTLATAVATTPAHHITLWTALDHTHPLFLELARRYPIELRAQPEATWVNACIMPWRRCPGPGC
ncbi:hypothetical protein [Halomonas sp. BC04]|uniref:hypothetical protein n=1 Tax=Halomonas sp. BC04 TaxID=1403540 RepID=UPI0003ED6FBE|nr:hypothetical protein Q427_10745 [Halomonas sp. BC04]